MSKRGSKGNTVATPDIQEKQARCARLAAQGMTYAEIAAQEGYSNESGARYAVRAHFRRAATETLEQMRPMLLERGELLWRSAMRHMSAAEARTKTVDGQTVPAPDEDAWARAHTQALKAAEYLGRVSGVTQAGPQVQVNVGVSAELEALKREWLALVEGRPVLEGQVVEVTDES